MIVTNRVPVIESAVSWPPARTPSTATKATAAVPSFNRLSDSISIRSRPCALDSLNVAITETGSVAAINTPKTIALPQFQESA